MADSNPSRRQRSNEADDASTLVFTGERIVPQADNCEPNFASRMYHEHLARYLFAGQIVSAKRVLDVGCGVGYGSQRLGEMGAASVTAFDLSEDAIRHARIHYSHPNVEFLVANAEEFTFDEKFDVVICFELIEHVPNPDKVIDAIAAALTDDGILVMSTPRALEQKRTHFHEHEFTFDEYLQLLKRRFSTVDIYVENNHFTSMVTKDAPTVLSRIECIKDQFDPAAADVFIAVASRSKKAAPDFEPTLVVDSDAYVTMLERDVQILHAAEDDLIEKLAAVEADATRVAEFKDREIERLVGEYKALFSDREALQTQLFEAKQSEAAAMSTIDSLTAQIETLVTAKKQVEDSLQELEMKLAEVEHERDELRAVTDSLKVRAEDAEARRLEAYEFARVSSDQALGLRRELAALRGQILDAVEQPSAPGHGSYDQRHREVVSAMQRLFLGTEATQYDAPDPVVERVRELALEVQRLHREIAALQEFQRHAEDWHRQILRLKKTFSWRVTSPFRWAARPFRKRR